MNSFAQAQNFWAKQTTQVIQSTTVIYGTDFDLWPRTCPVHEDRVAWK